MTELIGDIVIRCTGGTPTPAGQIIPTADFKVSLNTTVTSRLLDSNFSEAMLLIDNPSNPIKGTEFPNLLATGTGSYPSGAPNVFLGRQSGPNDIVFNGIPILPPDPNAVHIFRITNVRLNPALLAAGVPITEQVRITYNGRVFTLLDSPPLPVGTATPGLNFDFLNPGSAPPSPSTAGPTGLLRFTENFGTAFKTRVAGVTANNPAAPPGAQNIPGTIYNTESGLILPNVTGTAGLADHGTRLKAVFNNMPAGTRIFLADANDPTTSDSTIFARAVSCDGPAVLQPSQLNRFFELLLANGRGEACYEVTGANPLAVETFGIKVDMITTGIPQMQTVVPTVTGSWVTSPTLDSYLNTLSSFDGSTIPRFNFVSDAGTTRWVEGYLALISQPAGEIRGTGGSPSFQQGDGTPVQTLSFEQIAKEDSERERRKTIVYLRSGPNRLTGLDLTQTSSNVRNSEIRPGVAGWLTATLQSTSTPAAVRVEVDPAGLEPGTYSGMITLTSTTPGAGPFQLPVTLNVAANGPRIKSFGIASAASYASNVIAPGEALAIFGSNFGPNQIVTLKLTNGVTADTTLGGTRVLFDGVAAPLIYSVNGVVSCFVPFNVAGKKFVKVEVEQNGVKSLPVTVAVAAAVPALLTADFSGGGQGSFLSADYKFNGTEGALPGDFILLFGTGGGELTSPVADGGINAGGSLKASVRKVFLDGVEVPFEYFGPAPGQIEGVFQVNIKLPANIRRNANVPVVVQIGDYKSQPGVTIRVK
jgi:uncharacterized protein (TIGR03437 family)